MIPEPHPREEKGRQKCEGTRFLKEGAPRTAHTVISELLEAPRRPSGTRFFWRSAHGDHASVLHRGVSRAVSLKMHVGATPSGPEPSAKNSNIAGGRLNLVSNVGQSRVQRGIPACRFLALVGPASLPVR
jgi:hypothetical protein